MSSGPHPHSHWSLRRTVGSLLTNPAVMKNVAGTLCLDSIGSAYE
jgi:hypothetical protein